MSGEDERFFGLSEIAKRQQAQVEAALAALATERDKLAQEREALARQVDALEGRIRQAVTGAVAAGFAEVGKAGVRTIRRSSRSGTVSCSCGFRPDRVLDHLSRIAEATVGGNDLSNAGEDATCRSKAPTWRYLFPRQPAVSPAKYC
jgi:phosphate uptake regulator